jgi:phosphoribosylformylglycinamidine synthase
MLPGFDGITDRQTATLTFNDSGRFEDRWIHLRPDATSPCVFTKGLKGLTLPVRHGEGKFVPLDEEILGRLHREHLICLQYSDERSEKATLDYPANPNGSVDAIAGICNETGRIFGLMPHPEAFHHRTNHPRWTREELPEEGAGLALFRNAAAFLRSGTL